LRLGWEARAGEPPPALGELARQRDRTVDARQARHRTARVLCDQAQDIVCGCLSVGSDARQHKIKGRGRYNYLSDLPCIILQQREVRGLLAERLAAQQGGENANGKAMLRFVRRQKWLGARGEGWDIVVAYQTHAALLLP